MWRSESAEFEYWPRKCPLRNYPRSRGLFSFAEQIFFFFPPSSSWKIPSLFYCYLIVFHYQTINSNTKFIKGIKYQKNKEAKIALLIILLLVVLHKLINFNRPGPRLLFENIFSGFENNFIVDRFYISMRLIIN